jgi:peptide-methionine (S)-S-oxide reductase
MFSLAACSAGNDEQAGTTKAQGKEKWEDQPGLKTAYFASGCFWCVEAIYEEVKGVKEAISGYAGGDQPNPTYDEVAAGRTDHAESVKVVYDPEVVDFRTLVEVYFGSQDPTQVNGQGPDHGKQYRSIIFYQDKEEMRIAQEVKREVAKQYEKPIAAEITSLKKFYEAEDYHQDYEKKNPNNSYVRNVSIPRLKRFEKKFQGLLKEQ